MKKKLKKVPVIVFDDEDDDFPIEVLPKKQKKKKPAVITLDFEDTVQKSFTNDRAEKYLTAVLQKLRLPVPDDYEQLEAAVSKALADLPLHVDFAEQDCLGLLYDPRDTACRKCPERKKCLKKFANDTDKLAAHIRTSDKKLDLPRLMDALGSFGDAEVQAILASVRVTKPNKNKNRLVNAVMLGVFDPIKRYHVLDADLPSSVKQGTFTQTLLSELLTKYKGQTTTLGDIVACIKEAAKTHQMVFSEEEAVKTCQAFCAAFSGVVIEPA